MTNLTVVEKLEHSSIDLTVTLLAHEPVCPLSSISSVATTQYEYSILSELDFLPRPSLGNRGQWGRTLKSKSLAGEWHPVTLAFGHCSIQDRISQMQASFVGPQRNHTSERPIAGILHYGALEPFGRILNASRDITRRSDRSVACQTIT